MAAAACGVAPLGWQAERLPASFFRSNRCLHSLSDGDWGLGWDFLRHLRDCGDACGATSRAPLEFISVEDELRFVKNLTASLSYFVIRAATAIVQLRILDAQFGGQFSGLNALLNQVYLYVTLFELGLAAAAVSLLYEPIHARNHQRTSELLSALARDTRRLIVVLSPLILGLLIVYSRSIQTTLPRTMVFGALALTAVSGLLTLFLLPYQSYLNASEKLYQVHLVLGVGLAAKTVLGLSAVRWTGNYLALPATNAVLSALELLAVRLLFFKQFPEFLRVRNPRVTTELRTKAKYALCHRVGGLIYYQSDFVILSLAATLMAVNEYAKYQYIAAGILGISTAAFTSMTASIARKQIGAGPNRRTSQYRHVSLVCHFTAIGFALAFYFTANDLVRVMYRTGTQASQLTLILFSSLLFLNLVKAVDDTFISAKGAFQAAVYLPLLEPVVYIPLGVFLVREHGFNGILMAAIAVNVLFACIGKTAVVAKAVLEIPVFRIVRLRALNLVAALVLVTPLVWWYLHSGAFAGSGVLRFALQNMAAAVYMIPVSYLLIGRGYRSENFAEAIDQEVNV